MDVTAEPLERVEKEPFGEMADKPRLEVKDGHRGDCSFSGKSCLG